MSSTTSAVLFCPSSHLSPPIPVATTTGLRSGKSPLTQTGEILFGEIYSWESSLALSCHQKNSPDSTLCHGVHYLTFSWLFFSSLISVLQGIIDFAWKLFSFFFFWKLFSSRQKYLSIQSSLLVAGIFFAYVCVRERMWKCFWCMLLGESSLSSNPSKCKSSGLIALLFPNRVYVLCSVGCQVHMN